MTLLVRASELIGTPVVTLDGDDIGEVKDVVLGLERTALVGFTLRGRGRLSGPLRSSLPWTAVHAVGRDAVMVEDGSAVGESTTVLRDDDEPTDLLHIDVISDDGRQLGTVVDVVVAAGHPAEVVGFEVEEGQGMARPGQRVLVPVDEMVSASAEALMVPADALRYARDDLTGFGAGYDELRRNRAGARRQEGSTDAVS
jgi:sporulation protein YlmC with PRC-barrel domain